MTETPSALSLAAIAVYLVVASATALACATSRTKSQRHWHFRAWLILTFLFLLLAASRGLGLEDILRAELRDWLRAEGVMGERRTWQGYVITAMILVFVTAAFLALYRATSRMAGRRNFATIIALASGAAMIGLIGLRMISLHAMDTLLYGPLKLNWVGDIGASMVAFTAGLVYIRLVRARP